jgi:hypothetical protein
MEDVRGQVQLLNLAPVPGNVFGIGKIGQDTAAVAATAERPAFFCGEGLTYPPASPSSVIATVSREDIHRTLIQSLPSLL